MHRISATNFLSWATGVLAVAGGLVFQFDLWRLMDGGIVAIALIAAVVVIAWWAIDKYLHSRHSRQMRQFAAMHGWTYLDYTKRYTRKLRGYPFGTGRDARDTAVLTGTFHGMQCATFTHEFIASSSDQDNAPQAFQITLVELPVALPQVDIVPDDWAAKVAKSIGGQDIDFESAEFNKHWRVMCRNAKYAHDIVHPRMIERLNRPDARGIALRVESNYVIAWQAGRQGPDDLARRLGVLTSVAGLLPEFVLREFAELHQRAAEGAPQPAEGAPEWATKPYALTSGKYTGIGADAYPDLPPIEGGPSLKKPGMFPFPFIGGGGIDDWGGGAFGSGGGAA